jgi:hypothetical protein
VFRRLAIAVAVLSALALGAMLWIYVATEQAPALAQRDPPAPGVPPSPDDVPPPSPPGPGGALVIPPPDPAVAAPEEPPIPRYQPPAGTWEAIAPVANPRALGPVGGALSRDLALLQPQLSGCFDEDTAARFGREKVTVTQDLERMDGQGMTVLMLQIESGRGRATIVDAPVETPGTASDGTIACAQRALRGRSVRTVDTPPGRHRMLFNLHP